MNGKSKTDNGKWKTPVFNAAFSFSFCVFVGGIVPGYFCKSRIEPSAAVYAFYIFGYVTATFFVGRDAADKDSSSVDAGKIENLQMEISVLRDEVRLLSARLNKWAETVKLFI